MKTSVLDSRPAAPTALAAFSVLVGLSLAVGLPSRGRADGPAPDPEAAALAAIEKLGGSVRSVSGGCDDREVEFHLGGRGLTDAGLVHVAALKNVASLNLRDTRISSAGLRHLKGLTKLRWLHLERTAIGDDGVENLAGLVHLEYLNLYATKITDKSLDHLKGLGKLRRLYVWQTGVTDAGAERLCEQLPGLTIVQGVDLSKLPIYSLKPPEPPRPTETLKWVPVDDATEVPSRSLNGLNTQVYFENKSGRRVKLYWVSYGGELKLYAELAPGTTRQQNTYSRNTWLIADGNDKPLGYFTVGVEVSLAVIPETAAAPEKKQPRG